MARNTVGNKGIKIDVNKNTKDGKKGEERTEGKQESQKWCFIHIPIKRKHFKTPRIMSPVLRSSQLYLTKQNRNNVKKDQTY